MWLVIYIFLWMYFAKRALWIKLSIFWQEDKMEGIIGTLDFYAPVLVLGVVVIGIVYFMKKRNDRK